MRKSIEILNDLEQSGFVTRYAVGGAIGAMFYAEPQSTFDLDVFVILPVSASGLLTLTPLYAELQRRGYVPEAEFVFIEGTPIQFLPAYNALLEEALEMAVILSYEDVLVRVMRVEHLMAICVQTHRQKDRMRLALLMDQAEYHPGDLEDILRRHALYEDWLAWTA